MNKVVKCINETCGQHFMHTEIDTKCPFCHTEYVEVNEVAEKESQEAKIQSAQSEKKAPIKIKKESFKIWKDS